MRNSGVKSMVMLLAVLTTAVFMSGCCVSVQIGGRHLLARSPEFEHHEFAAPYHHGKVCPWTERDRCRPQWRDGHRYPFWGRDGRECPAMHERPMMRGPEKPMMHGQGMPMMHDGKGAPACGNAGCQCGSCNMKCGPDCAKYPAKPGPKKDDGKPAPPAVPAPAGK